MLSEKERHRLSELVDLVHMTKDVFIADAKLGSSTGDSHQHLHMMLISIQQLGKFLEENHEKLERPFKPNGKTQ